MRVYIGGDCAPAKALRGLLSRHNFHLSAFDPDFTIHIDESDEPGTPILDSVSCELEAAVLEQLRKLTASPVTLLTAGGVQHDRAVRIVVSSTEAERRAVEIAVFRALLKLTTPGRRQSWWSRWFQQRGEE